MDEDQGHRCREADFDAFYLGTRLRVLRQLTAMTADPELAADVLQEAYARAWQRWRVVSRLDDPSAWVRKVAWRLAVSQHRRASVASRVRHLLALRGGEERCLSDTSMDIQRALRQLPDHQRRVLVLHELCGLSVEEVASEVAIPVGTVKSRLFRARAALADLLGPEYVPIDGSSDRHPTVESARVQREGL